MASSYNPPPLVSNAQGFNARSSWSPAKTPPNSKPSRSTTSTIRPQRPVRGIPRGHPRAFRLEPPPLYPHRGPILQADAPTGKAAQQSSTPRRHRAQLLPRSQGTAPQSNASVRLTVKLWAPDAVPPPANSSWTSAPASPERSPNWLRFFSRSRATCAARRPRSASGALAGRQPPLRRLILRAAQRIQIAFGALRIVGLAQRASMQNQPVANTIH